MQSEQIGDIEVRTPETDEEARNSAMGFKPGYNTYYRSDALKAIDDANRPQTHRDDLVDWEDRVQQISACQDGDMQLNEAGAAELAKYCGGAQAGIRVRRQIPGREPEVVVQLLGPPETGEIAPGVPLEVANLNTAGKSTDYSDATVDEFQVAAAKVGIEMVPRTPGLERGEAYEVVLAAGKALREATGGVRYVSKTTGRMEGAIFNIGSLTHPTVLGPLDGKTAE